ncbi:MAG: hypothetical protein CMD18_03450 [Flavobacteriales bacterium]|nr:hypothetical protein [Flavobacteriales bacterium]|tara:strand:+ start:4323 stop:5318 length:996 start_codon:yes stop_codon:yes gene_type:complete
MNNYLTIQNELLILIKEKTDVKLVDVLMETLHISLDSAYRRIRLEKIFTLDEIIKISNTFNISIDALISYNSSDSVLFSFPFKSSQFNLEEYFSKILIHLQKIKDENGIIYYSAKDIPIFHFFQDKKLLAFKFHYWLNTMNHENDIVKKEFSYELIPAKLAELTRKIYSIYTQIRTHEIWNYETLTRTSSQITYYYEMGIITIKQAEELQLRLVDFINHIEDECKVGKKYFIDNQPLSTDENYDLYYNEIIAADNSIYAEYGNIKESFLPHIVLNYMTTDNIQYSEYNKTVFDTVINKSTLISKVNEKDRRKFFNFNKDFVNRQLDRLKFI